MLQIWKNIFCSIVGGWNKELKVKKFVFLELLSFNDLLQNNYFENFNLQKTKLKYTCLKCLFLWPSWLRLFRSVCLFVIEKWNKAVIHCTHKQKPEILLNKHFQKMTLSNEFAKSCARSAYVPPWFTCANVPYGLPMFQIGVPTC